MTVANRPLYEIAFATVLAALLTAITFRHGPLLTFDGYHYSEFAKQFTREWPDRFGNHWPFGYPLAGGVLGRAGLAAYPALLLVSGIGVVAWLALAHRMLLEHPGRLAFLLALAGAPIVAQQWGGVLTELPFGAALLGLAFSLGHFPARAALWTSAACATLAFSLRYAGIIAVGLLALWLGWRWRDLQRARRGGESVAAVLLASTAMLAAIGWNVVQSGYASGAGRGAAEGLRALPGQLASFGWSAPSALVAGGLRDRVGPESAWGLSIGGVLFAAIAAMCWVSWRSPRSHYSRPLALVAFGYCSGMAVLRCVGEFDALHSARTFLPALAPLALLTAERLRARPRWAIAAAGTLLLFGLISAARGVSRAIGADVRPAVAAIRAGIAAGDRIGINDDAFSVSAYLPQPARRVYAEFWNATMEERYLVFGAAPAARNGSNACLAPEWSALAERLVAEGRYRYLLRSSGLLALERVIRASPVSTFTSAPHPL